MPTPSDSGRAGQLRISKLRRFPPTRPGTTATPITQSIGQTGSLASVTVPIAATTPGNLVVAFYDRSGGQATGALTSVTDSAGGTWTLATHGAAPGVSNTRIECWYRENCPSITSVTFNSGTAQFNGWNISEWAGMALSNALDVASADNSFSPTSSTTCTTPPVSPSQINDLIIGAAHFGQATTTLNQPGFTALGDFDDPAPGSGRAAFRFDNGDGPYSAQWILGAAKQPGIITVAFKRATPIPRPLTFVPQPPARHLLAWLRRPRTIVPLQADVVVTVTPFVPIDAAGGTQRPRWFATRRGATQPVPYQVVVTVTPPPPDVKRPRKGWPSYPRSFVAQPPTAIVYGPVPVDAASPRAMWRPRSRPRVVPPVPGTTITIDSPPSVPDSASQRPSWHMRPRTHRADVVPPVPGSCDVPPVIVQTAAATETATSTSLAINGLTTRAGNLLMLAIEIRSAGAAPSSITDSAGNTWAQVGRAQASGSISIALWATNNSVPGAITNGNITVHFGVAQAAAIRMWEISGAVNTNPVDQFIAAGSSAPSITATSGLSNPQAAAGELAFGAVGVHSGTATPHTYSAAGFTQGAEALSWPTPTTGDDSIVTTTVGSLHAGELLIANLAPQAYTVTIDSAANWAAMMWTLKCAGLAAVPLPPTSRTIRRPAWLPRARSRQAQPVQTPPVVTVTVWPPDSNSPHFIWQPRARARQTFVINTPAPTPPPNAASPAATWRMHTHGRSTFVVFTPPAPALPPGSESPRPVWRVRVHHTDTQVPPPQVNVGTTPVVEQHRGLFRQPWLGRGKPRQAQPPWPSIVITTPPPYPVVTRRHRRAPWLPRAKSRQAQPPWPQAVNPSYPPIPVGRLQRQRWWPHVKLRQSGTVQTPPVTVVTTWLPDAHSPRRKVPWRSRVRVSQPVQIVTPGWITDTRRARLRPWVTVRTHSTSILVTPATVPSMVTQPGRPKRVAWFPRKRPRVAQPPTSILYTVVVEQRRQRRIGFLPRRRGQASQPVQTPTVNLIPPPYPVETRRFRRWMWALTRRRPYEAIVVQVPPIIGTGLRVRISGREAGPARGLEPPTTYGGREAPRNISGRRSASPVGEEPDSSVGGEEDGT